MDQYSVAWFHAVHLQAAHQLANEASGLNECQPPSIIKSVNIDLNEAIYCHMFCPANDNMKKTLTDLFSLHPGPLKVHESRSVLKSAMRRRGENTIFLVERFLYEYLFVVPRVDQLF